MGKLNWTDFTGLADGCVLKDFTVSITFKHRATVVEIAVWSQLKEVEVVDVGGIAEGEAWEGLEELLGGAISTCPIKGRTE